MGFYIVKGSYDDLLKTLEANRTVLSKLQPRGQGLAHTPMGTVPYSYSFEASAICFTDALRAEQYLKDIGFVNELVSSGLPPLDPVVEPPYTSYTEEGFGVKEYTDQSLIPPSTPSFVKPTIPAETQSAEGQNN